MPKPNANIERPGHPGHQPDVHIHIHGGDIAAAIDRMSENVGKYLAVIAVGSNPDNPAVQAAVDALAAQTKAQTDALQAAVDANAPAAP